MTEILATSIGAGIGIVAGLIAIVALLSTVLAPGQIDVGVPGTYYASAGFVRTNRTGATIAFGGCAIVDNAWAQAESTTVATGMQNLTGVTTALLKAGRFAFCLDTAGVADNAEGRFCDTPGAVIDVLVEGTAAISKGTLLKGVNGQAYLVAATNGTDRPVARALEAYSTASTTTIKAQIFPEGIVAIA